MKALLLAVLWLAGACDESLDIEPTQELESVYFETEERVQRGVGAAYALFANLYGPRLDANTLHPFWLLPPDDLTSDGAGIAFETFSGLNGSSGVIENTWQTMYQIVGRTNFMLEKLADSEIQAVYTTADLNDANRGEMLFIRSWVFYNLWDWFRKAPLPIDRITSPENSELPPTEGLEMLNQAIEDLEEAATLLPESWDQRNLGRVTKDGAYGMLVKCYVLRACHDSKNAADYNKAIEAFNKISSSRQLVNFGENFDYRFENNAESLFEFQASRAPVQDNAWLNNNFGGNVGQMGAFYHYSNTHWGNYSSGIIGPTMKLINAFEMGDPRMEETISDNPSNLNGRLWWIAPGWSRFNGYQLTKYTKGERGDIYEPQWNLSSGNNTRLLRLADVKLAVAEAYLATGNQAKALEQVNDIRERARMSTEDGTEAAVPADLASVTMDDIMHERFVELAAEGHRWTDLRRWHAAGYINLATWSADDFGYPLAAVDFDFTVPENLVFPIPNSELDRNPLMAASGQNPGY
jgi:hypothetical protein